jgi:hypothetical protein
LLSGQPYTAGGPESWDAVVQSAEVPAQIIQPFEKRATTELVVQETTISSQPLLKLPISYVSAVQAYGGHVDEAHLNAKGVVNVWLR